MLLQACITSNDKVASLCCIRSLMISVIFSTCLLYQPRWDRGPGTMPSFCINLPKAMKSSTHALSRNKKSSTIITLNNRNMGDHDYDKDKLFVELYTPADFGPYLQDKLKQKS
ncbi:phosphatidylinositol/phosphatidylcholine transfer protein SFH8-like [Iris pallida]|uniref:Phosphatidylinositol/phosphatidylcholine transfer protein SFH8-like n=1 Tax=Iris pallida TaxID=29817 RepID=A0AAX6GZ06_IRIPA|nr:phosphatidylinositol/phosphatidylcholine transfer protein SFH8-like [Iris pallida]KAJ6833561.1 phosphatidylinositol/phosphatidylcholine transfer protein SFH8-like [Iris pallida]